VPFDVADASAARSHCGLSGHMNALKSCVNNAGIRHDALLVFMKPEQWHEVLATNLHSFYT